MNLEFDWYKGQDIWGAISYWIDVKPSPLRFSELFGFYHDNSDIVIEFSKSQNNFYPDRHMVVVARFISYFEWVLTTENVRF